MWQRRRNQIAGVGAVAGLLVLAWWWSASVNRLTPAVASLSNPTGMADAAEANWPQLRGPTFDGLSVETGLAESWPDDGPPVVWTIEMGQGYSSFIAVGNHVYTQKQSLYQQSVVCLDSATGHTIWSYNYSWPYDGGGLYPGPRSTPTWHEGRIYFAAPDGMIGCLNGDTGQSIWSCNPKKMYHGRGTDFGYACSPVIIDGKVIVPVGGLNASVVALDIRDGASIWASGESSASYATPLPISLHGRSLVVTPLENSIAAFDVQTGKHLWEIEFSEGYDEHSVAPLYQEPFLCMSSPFRAGAKCYRLTDVIETMSNETATAVEVEPTDGLKDDSKPATTKPGWPVLKWESPKFSNDVASSVLVGGRLYGFDLRDPQSRLDRPSRGEFRCLDFESGRILWSTDKVGQANIIVADQKLILFNDSGELILAQSGTDEYVELARTQVFRDEICWSSPALHRGCVYLRTQTRAACLDIGAVAYRAPRPTQRVADIPRGRMFDSKWLIGGEREYPATTPEWTEFRLWYGWSLAGMALASVVSVLSLVVIRGCSRQLRVRRVEQNEPVRASNDGTHLAVSNPPPNVLKDREETCAIPSGASAKPERPGHPSERPDYRLTSTMGNHQLELGRCDSISVSRTLFWIVVLMIGICGTPIVNSWQNEYVLLWPLVLWAAFQMTINVIRWTEIRQHRRHWRWLSRCCGILFIAVCMLYFTLCRGLGYAIEWSFLIGFPPAFAFAIWAARFLTNRSRFWPITDFAFCVLSFTVYFWSSVIFIKWKLVVGS